MVRVPLIHPIIFEGERTLAWGPAASGKSWVALATSLSVATGTSYLPPWAAPTTAPVVYVDGEDNTDELARRVLRITGGSKVPDNLVLIRATGGLHQNLDALRDLLADIRPALVVLDSVRSLDAGGPNASTYENAWPFYKALENAQHDPSCSLLAIHHVAKDTKLSNSPRGDSAWRDGARVGIEVSSKATGDTSSAITLQFHKMSNDRLPQPAVITVTYGPQVTFRVGPAEDQPTRVRAAIGGLFEDHGQAVSSSTILERLNESDGPHLAKETLRKVLTRLVETKEIVCTGKSSATRYRPVTEDDLAETEKLL